MREGTARAFQAYDRPLESVTPFKCLGWIMTASDENWTAVVVKLWKARKIWACLSRILGREGKSKGFGDFFQCVSIGSTNFWDGDVDNDPPHGTGLGGVPTKDN